MQLSLYFHQMFYLVLILEIHKSIPAVLAWAIQIIMEVTKVFASSLTVLM